MYIVKCFVLMFLILFFIIMGLCNPHVNNKTEKKNNFFSTITECAFFISITRILRFFNTTPEQYSVIFTSGATASLKLLAESFSFKSQVTSDEANYCSYCKRKKITEIGTCVDRGFPCNTDNEKSPGHHFNHGDCSSSNSPNNGRFYYMEDNHTSVVGMRQLINSRGVDCKCILNHDIELCFSEELRKCDSLQPGGNSLVAYPAQSNFNGRKYPLQWIKTIHKGNAHKSSEISSQVSESDKDGSSQCNYVQSNWYVVLDAASYVSTSPLDLSCYEPDFVVLSFYKIFGFPTGLGKRLLLLYYDFKIKCNES